MTPSIEPLAPTKRATLMLESIPYTSAIHALRELGAKRIENSGGHNTERYELPNRKVVGMANSSRRQNEMHTWSAKRFINEVSAAGIDENLFLALANSQSVAWKRHDPWVEHLTGMLKEHRGSFDLTDKNERERFLRIALEHYPPAVAAAAQVAQTEPVEEPAPPPSHTLREAVELALDESNLHMKRTYYSRIKSTLYAASGPAFDLVKEHIVSVPNTKLPNLTQEGALLIASYIEEEEFKRRGPPPVRETRTELELSTELLENLTPEYLAEPEPVEEPMTEAQDVTATVIPAEQPRRVQFATGQANPPFGSTPQTAPPERSPQTLLDACNNLGIIPAWEGYTLNVEGTLWEIAGAVINRR